MPLSNVEPQSFSDCYSRHFRAIMLLAIFISIVCVTEQLCVITVNRRTVDMPACQWYCSWCWWLMAMWRCRTSTVWRRTRRRRHRSAALRQPHCTRVQSCPKMSVAFLIFSRWYCCMQHDRLLAWYWRLFVCLSVCLSVHLDRGVPSRQLHFRFFRHLL